jgi:hypothetical protein
VFMMTFATSHPLESVFQAAALKVAGKFMLYTGYMSKTVFSDWKPTGI